MSVENDPRELIGAYVLGACSPEEAAVVRERMAADSVFRAEVESFDPVREALLLVPAPDVRPSPDLRARLMAQVQEEASLFGAAGSTVDDGPASRSEAPSRPAPDRTANHPVGRIEDPQGAVDAPRAASAAPEASSPKRSGFLGALRHPARAVALAGVLVVLVVGGIVAGGNGGGSDEPAGRQIPGQVLGSVEGTKASVKLVASSGDNRLELDGFPAAGRGKEYQVWLQTGTGDPRPTTVLFDVDGSGHAEAKIPGDLQTVDNVLVTAEPAGGSQAPTSTPVLKVTV